LLFDEEITWKELTKKFDWDSEEIRSELIKKNKIYFDNDIIKNKGCDKAITKAISNHESAVIRGQKGALAKRSSASSSAQAEGKQTINYKLLTINYNNISSSWNEIIPTSHIKEFNETRKTLFRKRFKQYFNEDYEEWDKFLKKIANISFLWGDNDRGWKADFNWVLNENNYAKIIEGKYEKEDEKISVSQETKPQDKVKQWLKVIENPSPFMLSQAEKNFQEIQDLYRQKLLTIEQVKILGVRVE
jgi:hypothetical protein